MNNTSTKIISVIFILLFLLQFDIPVDGSSLGVIPYKIEVDSALKGESYKRSLRVINGGNFSVNFNLSCSENFAEWITFYKDENLSIPIQNITIEPTTKKYVYIDISIPKDIPNGMKDGFLYVKSFPISTNNNDSVENTTTGFTILRFPVNLNVNVTGEQALSGIVKEISASDFETGTSQIFKIRFKNSGNVKANPLIIINILRQGWPIETIEYSDETIDPGIIKNIFVEWENPNLESGDYSAEIQVILDGLEIKNESLQFSVFPRGTLTRKGEITNLSYIGESFIGNTIKIQAKFKNTGKIETSAKFISEIFKDNQLITVIESNDEPIVNIGKTYTFTSYYKIEENGQYRINGFIIFENNQTGTKEIKFNVGQQTLDANHLSMVVMISTFLLLSIVVYYRKKTRFKKD